MESLRIAWKRIERGPARKKGIQPQFYELRRRLSILGLRALSRTCMDPYRSKAFYFVEADSAFSWCYTIV